MCRNDRENVMLLSCHHITPSWWLSSIDYSQTKNLDMCFPQETLPDFLCIIPSGFTSHPHTFNLHLFYHFPFFIIYFDLGNFTSIPSDITPCPKNMIFVFKVHVFDFY